MHPGTPLLAILARPELPGFDVPAPDAPAPKQPDAQERRQRGYLSYSTLAPAFRRFVRGALAASSLGRDEMEAARAASLHWLRHTHATRLVENGAAIDVVQANLGQADPRTTARYFRSQQRRQREAVEAVFCEKA